MRRAGFVVPLLLALAGGLLPRGALAASGGGFNPLLDPNGADAADDFAPVIIYKKPVPLRPGAGAAETAKACNACHSSDYILMDSRFLTAAQWRQELERMRSLFGARIDPPAAATIAAYLGAHYAAPPTTPNTAANPASVAGDEKPPPPTINRKPPPVRRRALVQ